MLTKTMYKTYLRNKVVVKYGISHLDTEKQDEILRSHANLDGDTAIAIEMDLDRHPDYRDYSTILYDDDGVPMINSKELYQILPTLSLSKIGDVS